MTKRIVHVVALFSLLALAVSPGFSQTEAELKNYLSQKLGMTPDQIASVRNGQAFAKTLDSRTPAEIFVFGVVYINAAPEGYLKFATDYNRMSKIPGYLAIREFGQPPQLSDLQGFAFGSEDVKGLKECEPGDCVVQLPASTMEELRQAVNWSAPNADDQVNQFVQKLALSRLLQYQKEGGRVLGAVYNDKKEQVNVSEQFRYMLSYSQALPQVLPDLHNYLLNYPQAKPANVEDSFYWDNVKFGLKPTLRILHVMTLRGAGPRQPAYVIAEKQLYSSHYFETALDLAFCIRGDDPKQPGFYLVRVMGSEQAGLTGFKGSIVRKVAVSRSVSGLQKSLAAIKDALEHKQ